MVTKLLLGLSLLVGYMLFNPFTTIATETISPQLTAGMATTEGPVKSTPSITTQTSQSNRANSYIIDLRSSMDTNTMIVLLVAAIFGMLGGLSHKLTSPPDDKTPWYNYVVVGAVAALAVLFIFDPKDALKLIALSIAAGYGGKAVLDAMEARVKTALAQAETTKAKEDGKKTAEVAKQAIDHAQNLSQINIQLNKALRDAKGGQSTESILESYKVPLSINVRTYLAKTPESVTDELKQLANRLDSLKGSFEDK